MDDPAKIIYVSDVFWQKAVSGGERGGEWREHEGWPHTYRLIGKCVWVHDPDDNAYETDCGERWQFVDGGPKENNVTFCHGCGGRVGVER